MSKEKQIDNKVQPAQFQLLFELDGNELLRYNVRLNHFNYQFLRSDELFYTLRNCVRYIKNDLVSKSRIYSHYIINKPTKLTGFVDPSETSYYYDDTFQEHIVYGVTSKEEEKPEKTFKFSFICNDRPTYEEIFDVTHIQPYIFEKFNLFNSLSNVEFSDLIKLDFQYALIHKMQMGKENLINKIIDDINEVAKEFVL